MVSDKDSSRAVAEALLLAVHVACLATVAVDFGVHLFTKDAWHDGSWAGLLVSLLFATRWVGITIQPPGYAESRSQLSSAVTFATTGAGLLIGGDYIAYLIDQILENEYCPVEYKLPCAFRETALALFMLQALVVVASVAWISAKHPKAPRMPKGTPFLLLIVGAVSTGIYLVHPDVEGHANRQEVFVMLFSLQVGMAVASCGFFLAQDVPLVGKLGLGAMAVGACLVCSFAGAAGGVALHTRDGLPSTSSLHFSSAVFSAMGGLAMLAALL